MPDDIPSGSFRMAELDGHLSLDRLLRLGCTGEVHVLAGRSELNRLIAWVSLLSGTRPYDHPPIPAGLVLVAPPYADLRSQLRLLQQHQVDGAAVAQTQVPQEIIDWADESDFPLVALPDDTDYRQLQRNLLRLLIDAEAALVAREAELYQHLTRLSMENQGIEAIARAISQFTGKGIVVHDKRLQVLTSVAGPGAGPAWPEMVERLSSWTMLPAELRDRKRAASIHDAICQPINGEVVRLLAPIIVQEMARGFVSIVHSSADFDQLDRIALEQGTAACALEMAKVKAISEAQKRLTGDLIEAVLSNSVNELDAVRWADRSGYRRSGPHVAMAMQWSPDNAPSLRRLETIVNGEMKRIPSRLLTLNRGDDIVVFYALHLERGIKDAQHWAQTLYEIASAEYPRAHLALGIGRPSDTLAGLRHSYREAAQAMAIAHKLRQNRPQYFGDLGIYRLLLQLEGSPELRTFSHEILGSVVQYDRTQGTDLVQTLGAYFRHNANLVQTAQALHIHRNTLLYRLQRASEIGNFDLDSAETRLAIQLALRANQLSGDDGDSSLSL